MPLSFASMPRGAFTGYQMIFSFFSCFLCRKRKVNAESVSLPHKWNKRPHTAGNPGKNDCCHPAGQVPSDRKTIILPLLWFALFTLPVMSFSFWWFLFLRIFPLKFFSTQSASGFVYLHFAPFSEPHQSVIFRSGRKGNSGIGRESKVKPPVFCGNLQPFG